jgi:hypothetical protein
MAKIDKKRKVIELKKKPVKKQRIGELRFRRNLIKFMLRQMETDGYFLSRPEETAVAIEREREHLRVINARIKEITEPVGITIDLQPASLTAKAK